MDDLESVARRGECVELRAVDDLLFVARAEQQSRVDGRAGSAAVADHRHERHDPRAAGDQEQRAAERRLPHEVPADGTADLQSIADDDRLVQERRHLAFGDPLDRDVDLAITLRLRCDRVASLDAIAVLGRQAQVDVLARSMTRPARQSECQ